jgi:excisionase family DNA binding protein
MDKTRHTQLIGAPVPIGTAAAMLNVAVETLRRWETEGKITSTRTPGGQRRFALDEIERVKNGEPAEPAEAVQP